MLSMRVGMALMAVLASAATAMAVQELSVDSLTLAPGATDTLVVSGNIDVPSAGVTIMVVLSPQDGGTNGTTGTLVFTPGPSDIIQLGHPWSTQGPISYWDADDLGYPSENFYSDINGDGADEAVTHDGPLAGFPVVASGDASGVWDVSLSSVTFSIDSTWDADPPITTTLIAGTITVGECSGDPDCDDTIACTDDNCVDSVCVYTPNDANCDDSLYCNGAETCDAALDCQPGTAVDCDDSVGCTDDSCNEGTDSCDSVANDANCDDGVYCNGAETCDAALDCQAGTAVDCTDAVGCTDDSCNEGTDSCDNLPNDGLCDDGVYCNGAETCDALLDCQAGTTVDCDDSVTCTDDSCNEGTDSCDNVANDANCDDALYCNGTETCDAVLDCQAGTTVDCDDSVGCTDDSCNEGTDSCDSVANDANCDDSLYCNGAETCDAALDCQAGTAVDCTDAVGCTDDSCNEGADACDNLPNDGLCDDGVYCNGAETCDALLDCQVGTAVDCDDTVGCTDDSCNEGTDSCDNVPNDGLCDDGIYCNGAEICDGLLDCQAGTTVDCDDSVGCTDDSCNEGTDSCDNVANDANCDDALYCNGAETCDALLDCQAGTTVDCDDSVGCTDDSCNEGTDACDSVANDANCDDGLYCNGAETCDAVLDCQAGTTVDCSDAVGCTDDSCNEGTDACDNAPNDSLCDDSVYCNGAETCDAALDCQVGTAVDCDDSVGCTDDSCNEGTDSCDNVANDANCDDSLYCNGVETCDALLDCQAGTAVDCSDTVSCTDDSCNEGTDSCDNVANDANCDDGLYCNGVETCDAALDCQTGTAVDCSDGVGCTDDSCNEGTDACDNVPNDGLCDDGLYCTGVETCDSQDDCQAGTAVNCPDDGTFCNGEEFCDDEVDTCAHTGNPCPPDEFFCTGVEYCNEGTDACEHTGNPCLDDGIFCNGVEYCNEGTDTCEHTGRWCPDDGVFCDGVEFCDEDADTCGHAGDPCLDDGLYCNGADFCDEEADTCGHTGDPCVLPEVCDEDTDQCLPGDKNIMSMESCYDHGACLDLCLPIGCGTSGPPHDNLEPRLQLGIPPLLRVHCDGDVSSATCVVSGCSFAGTADVVADGSPTVEVYLSTILPPEECCTLTFSDGIAGVRTIVMLEGDVNYNGSVSSTDLSSIKARLGDSVTAAGAQYDVNRDCFVTTTDRSSVKARLGHGAPVPCPCP